MRDVQVLALAVDVNVDTTNRSASAITMTTNHQQIGKAGEFYTAALVCMEGLDAIMAPPGNAITDVIAHRAGASCTIQVKASGKRFERSADMFMRSELVTQTDFLVLVWFGGDHPVAYVLPRAATAEWCAMFNDTHAKSPATRMNLRSREYSRRTRTLGTSCARHWR